MKELWGFIVKEYQHIVRDRQSLVILLLLPIAQVVIFGYALRTDIRNVRVVMVDPVPDNATVKLRSRFEASDLFEVVGRTDRSTGLDELFARGAIDQAILFEEGTERRLGRGEEVGISIITDATDPNSGNGMQAYATAIIDRENRERMERSSPAAAAKRGIVPTLRMRFNPTLESVNLFAPGLIALVLTVVSALMSAISLSREKERGTLEILLVSPLRPWQIIVGKVLPYLLLGFANILSVLAVARFLFGVPFRGSFPLLLAESLLFIITCLSLGVLIATVTSSQRTAMMGALMGLMMPTTLLSGMIFPIESMPVWLQPVTHLIPGKWFILISRGIMLKGVGLEHVWRESLVLLGMMVVALTAAVRKFNIRLG